MIKSQASLVDRNLRRLQGRRVSSGWWARLHDMLPGGKPLRAQFFLEWNAFERGLLLTQHCLAGLCIGVFVVAIISVFSPAADGSAQSFSLGDLLIMLGCGAANMIYQSVMRRGAAMSDMTLAYLQEKIIGNPDQHPELIALAAKWAAKRGFLTEMNVQLLRRHANYKDNTQGEARPVIKKSTFKPFKFIQSVVLFIPSTLVSFTVGLYKGIQSIATSIIRAIHANQTTRQQQKETLTQTLLQVHVQAEEMQRSTPKAQGEAQGRRL